MPVFKLYADSLYPAWYRDHYTVEAESIEEAICTEIYDGDKLLYKDDSRQL